MMKIGHYQLQCAPRDFEANAAKVRSGLAAADAAGIEIISFPESFLNGFFSDESDARRYNMKVGDEQFEKFLLSTAQFGATFIVGFNERRGSDLFNTVLIAERGQLLGTYSKAFPEPYFTAGRDFPIFERNGVKFGVIICADGGYIEPARILALKGAQIIFAPHYNYITKEQLINHFQHVRADHIARATENAVWFLRGNNVTQGQDAGLNFEGVGYGDSYLLDPLGEITVRSQRDSECLITADIDFEQPKPFYSTRSQRSARELGKLLLETL